MAQEQDRDIHLPQPGAAPRAQHPKTAPRAVPLDEAAFRNLPLQDDSAVFSALEDGAGAAPRMPAAGTRQMGGHPAGMAQGAVPLDEAAFRAAAQPRQNAPQGFSALKMPRPGHGGRARRPPTGAEGRSNRPPRPGQAERRAPGRGRCARQGQLQPEQPGPFEGFSPCRGPSSARQRCGAARARRGRTHSARAHSTEKALRPAGSDSARRRKSPAPGKKKRRVWKNFWRRRCWQFAGTALGDNSPGHRDDFLWLDLAQLPTGCQHHLCAEHQGDWVSMGALSHQQKQWITWKMCRKT
ncbi:MAG: hypothetical protein ACLRPX_07960 [Ruthenibacterium sp.]